MTKKGKNTAILVGLIGSVLLVVALLWCFNISSQDNSKNAIRILIDHAPNALPNGQNGQSLDAFGKKFLALTSMGYQVVDFIPNESFDLVPPLPRKPILRFEVIRDEVTRALLFLKGDGDVLFDTLSLAKTEWMKKTHAEDTTIFNSPGLTLSFLGFNFNHPLMAELKVRQAISSALPLADWIQYKLFNWVDAVNDPLLPHFDIDHARALLEESGHPIQADGYRFHLVYYTTPVREGNELASLVREALKKVNIDVEVITLETSLYFDKIKRGDYDLMSSVWRRSEPNDSSADFLAPHATRNYFHYESEASKKLYSPGAKTGWSEVKPLIEGELPFFPLYFWRHGLVVAHRVSAPADLGSRIDETFRFLSELDLKSK